MRVKEMSTPLRETPEVKKFKIVFLAKLNALIPKLQEKYSGEKLQQAMIYANLLNNKLSSLGAFDLEGYIRIATDAATEFLEFEEMLPDPREYVELTKYKMG
mgnify:CR=1 FL=1